MRAQVVKLLKRPVFGILTAVVIGFLAGALVLAAAGYPPIDAYAILFGSIVKRPKYIAQVIINAAPLIFTGMSVAFAAKTGLFNIGAEGQFIAGSITAALVGYFWKLPPFIHPVVILLLAFCFGGLIGGFAAWLKNKFGIHEVISTIMLNWIVFNFSNFVVNLPSVKHSGMRSKEIQESAKILVLGAWKKSAEGKAALKDMPFLQDVLSTRLNWGIPLALVTAVVVWFLIRHTRTGFQLRAVGLNRDAAEFAGMPIRKNALLAMFISGGLAALGGAVIVLGTSFAIGVLSTQEGYGWDGITVSLIANGHPIACIFSALLFAGLRYGSAAVQQEIGAPSEIINIMIGVIVFSIALASVLPQIAARLEKRL